MMRLYALLLISSYLGVCNAQYHKDTLLLLTADSVKYWDFDKDEGGVMFRSDSCFVKYDSDRYYVPPCINSPFLNKCFFEDGMLTITMLGDQYKVLTVDDMNLTLSSENDTLFLHKSEDQNTAVQTLPEIRYGYVAAKPIDIEDFQTNTLTPFFKEEMRKDSIFKELNELYFIAKFRIKKDGSLESVHVIKSNFNLQQHILFVSQLEEQLERIKFSPARNEFSGEFYDSTVLYSMKITIEKDSKRPQSNEYN